MSADRSDRLYPTRPLPGVGAVVWREGHVLLERRGQPPAQGIWSIPGGLMELGETAMQAVVREVREECGIEITVGPVLGLFEPIQRDLDGRIRYHYVVIDFVARYRSGELCVGDDAADLRWADPVALEDYALTPAVHAMINRSRVLLREVPDLDDN